MSCRRVRELIPLHVEGDLSPRRARGVDAHVHGCDACRRLAAEQRESQAWLRSLPAPELDDAFHDGVRLGVWRRIDRARSQEAGGLPRRIAALLLRPAVLVGAVAVAAAAVAALIVVQLPRAPAPSVTVTAHPPRRTAPPAVAVKAPAPTDVVTPPRRDEPAPRLARRPRQAHREPPATLLADSRTAVRIEMQTPNPNIRIIWLAGR